jgi:hypothetical protein
MAGSIVLAELVASSDVGCVTLMESAFGKDISIILWVNFQFLSCKGDEY